MSDGEFLDLLSRYQQKLLRDAIRYWYSEARLPDHAACREFGASICAVLSAAVQSNDAKRQLAARLRAGLIASCFPD